MSCRILTSERASAVSPIVWPTVGNPSHRADAGRDAQGAAQPNNNEGGASREQITELERQIEGMRQQLQREVRSAREEGYREGEKSGAQQASAKLDGVLERAARALAELASLRSRIRRDTEKDLVALAIAIARRVLHRELSTDAEAIQGIVKAALEKLQSRDLTRVRIHPAHEKQVCNYLQHMSGVTNLEIVPDPALEVGGLVIETRRGDLDASVSSQLAEIGRGFADRIAR